MLTPRRNKSMLGVNMAKLSTTQFIAKARLKHGDFYDYSKSVYTGGLNKLTITCPVHGDFEQVASDHANVGKGCPACGRQRAAPVGFTTEEFVAKAKQIHGDFYDYSQVVYDNYKKPVVIMCPDHGAFEQIAGKHLRGNGCPKCRKGRITRKYKAKNKEERKADWLEKVTAKHGGKYDYSEAIYRNANTPVKIICSDHGPFLQTPSNHLTSKCPQCAHESKIVKLSKDKDEWLAKFNEVHDNKYGYTNLPENVSCGDMIYIDCPAHGTFRQIAYSHADGHGCPKCVNKISKPEDEIVAWLEELVPGIKVERNSRKLIPPFELDIFLPDYDLAIEFNGSYWHNDGRKPKKYHQDKALSCHSKGVALIHVYEYNWESKKEKYKQLISFRLSQSARVLNARQLNVVELVDTQMVRKFLDTNHFQGYVNAGVSVGLTDDEGTLVALMTFGKPRFSPDYQWELLRYCCSPDVRIRGGAGKMFKYFLKKYAEKGNQVLSFACLDYSNGNVYEALGFELKHVCEPNYVWFKSAGYVPRYKTQKHKLHKLLGKAFDDSLSESGNMRKAGYKRIYNAGNVCYVYNYE